MPGGRRTAGPHGVSSAPDAVASGSAGDAASGSTDGSGGGSGADSGVGSGSTGSDSGTSPGTISPASTGISSLADAAWIARVAAGTGIPSRALQSYAGAELRLAQEQPGCRLRWSTLAAIGSVESGHGSHDGSVLGADGTVAPAIISIALDGRTTDAIRDSDGGALDGDARWDRAVGPMQFLPSTWARFGADGSGDGVADPQNLDDAALTAGRYLCFDGADLATDAGWIAAIASYNDTLDYNHLIADAAKRYARVR
ncbi:hypothetical protein FJ656_28100 [Schumannella luteola]|nr:lytic murein transglycosylase [Schumannella luteola]TPX01359.1 hypothetical protein FJ656_28100 [Schumannella luteola]